MLKRKMLAVAVLAAVASLSVMVATASADGTLTWSPDYQGTTVNGNGDTVLNNVDCEDAAAPSEEYLHWISTVGGGTATVTEVTLHINGNDYPMTETGGAWHAYTPWYDLDDLKNVTVEAQYVGDLGNGEPGLRISHGCPPETQVADPLTAIKDATGSFDRTWDWTIQKDVADPTKVTGQVGDMATFNYTVTVTHDSGTPDNWLVKGKITVTNPNAADVEDVDVSDAIDGDADCTIDDGKGVDETIPANDAAEFGYTCEYDTAPEGTDKNTATVEWPAQTLSNNASLAVGSVKPTADVDWSAVAPNEIDECVDVDDAVDGGAAGPLGTGPVCVGDANPTEFKFSKDFDIVQGCVTHTNVASFTTNDTDTTDSDSASVEVCGVFFGKTQGFWGNTNGQQVLNGNYAFSAGNAVTLGGETGCSVLVDTAAKSLKILPNTLNGVSLITDCDATNERDTGINPGSLNNLLSQTLAISYNIKYIDHYAGQTVADLGCGSSTDTVQQVRDAANALIKNAQKNNGTTAVTQGQIGAMNTLLGCLNREA